MIYKTTRRHIPENKQASQPPMKESKIGHLLALFVPGFNPKYIADDVTDEIFQC